MKKIPMRSCVITHEKLDKRELFRVVRDKEGKVFVDDTHKANGRGAYLKKDLGVIEKARKSKALEKHLEVSINDSVYEELISKL
jgi:hypothetical protein